ncbi:PREDICTED: CD63 antigen [Nanorana parkeri]|uniref:CD63 antigen n=1 Tax=Nanorana parkeri TaxID=125878 RepID=UPI0008548319|nr:PREDICTED: CD63 antigen [Nanorana parkeri]
MAVEGGMKCVKYLIFLFNLLFCICGVALIGLGIYVQIYLNETLAIKSASASGAPIVLIAVGVVIFFISFFGCCGAAKENYCMVTTFAVLLVLVFLVEIAAAIAGYVFRNKVQDVYRDTFKDSMSKYNSTKQAKDKIDEVQKAFKCCGANASSDWNDYAPFNGTGIVPDTCCKVITTNCGRNATNIYTTGCIQSIDESVKRNVGIIAGVALGIAFFEILGIVFSCCLMKGIRSGYEVM